jgi:hypothetical protein
LQIVSKEYYNNASFLATLINTKIYISKMRIFIALFSFFISHQLSSQKVLSLLVPQNICIKSQDIWYGVYLHSDNLKEINLAANPVFIQIALHDRNGVQYYRTQHKMTTDHLSSKFQLPLNSKSDSYVLSATIYNADASTILVENSTLIHIVDESTTQIAEISAGNLKVCSGDCAVSPNTLIKINNNESNNLANAYHTRDRICIEDASVATDNFVVSSNNEFNANQDELYYQSASLANYQTLYTRPYIIKTTLPLGAGFFDVTEKKFYQLKKQAAQHLYLLQTDRVITTLNTQLLDILYNTVLEETPTLKYPTPFWTTATFTNLPFNEEKKNNVVKKLESIFIINGSVNPNIVNASIVAPTTVQNIITEITPDETYLMSNYQPFESIHLFLYEAVAPIKSIKKENSYELKMVNLRTKSLFPESPVILIDGKISDVDNVYKLEYKDIKKINIYRELNTTRNTLGSIAKNGVFEVITKKGLDTSKENFIKINGPAPTYKIETINIVNKQNIHIYPFVHFGKNIQNCIQHSDDTGKFTIRSYNNKGSKSYSYDVEL